MRLIFVLPLLMVAACGVENDPQNNQVILEYDEERIENAAEDVGNAAQDVGNEAENVAADVGNTDIDVDVNTNNSQ